MGHSGDSDDLVYLEEMLRRGCYLGMDRFGICDMTLSLKRRATAIAALCDKGFGHRILLSHDLAVYGGFAGTWDTFKNTKPEGKPLDFTFIHKSVLPELLSAGLTQAGFDKMMKENPRKFFEGK